VQAPQQQGNAAHEIEENKSTHLQQSRWRPEAV
jgi:hypothetical protein